MAEPIHYKFQIDSQTLECTEVPKPGQADRCKVAVYQDHQNVSFHLIREGKNFRPSPEDAERIKKAYPNYQAPAQKLKDFLEVTRDFYSLFGDNKAPTPIVGGIGVLTQSNVYGITEILINFIAHGNKEPKTQDQKSLQEAAVANSVAAFADPTMGTLLERTLSRLQQNTRLNPAARDRAKWLQRVIEVRQHLWSEVKPKMERSVELSGKLKSSTQKIIMFVFCPQILEDRGPKAALFSDDVTDAAQKHHDILSAIDPNYSVDQNFYAYMAEVLRAVKKQVRITDEIAKGSDQRMNQAIGLMEGEAKRETQRLLPYENNLKAFKISLVLKYGNSLERAAALKLLTDPITIKPNGESPVYVVPMATISRGLREWVERQTTPEKKRLATKAILYVLDQTMERGEKMEAYWNGSYRQVDSFFSSENFGKSLLGGNNNRELQDLIVWARSEAIDLGIDFSLGQNPQPALRKGTFWIETGTAVAAAVAYFAIPYGKTKAAYIGKGANLFVLCGAAGAASGNILSHITKASKGAEWYDVIGGTIASSACITVYGLTAKRPEETGPSEMMTPPPPPPHGDDDRVDKDPFGP